MWIWSLDQAFFGLVIFTLIYFNFSLKIQKLQTEAGPDGPTFARAHCTAPNATFFYLLSRELIDLIIVQTITKAFGDGREGGSSSWSLILGQIV